MHIAVGFLFGDLATLSCGYASGSALDRATYDVGSDTNMSVKLKANAPPGEAYCCSATHVMVKGAFQFREPIEVPLKGKGVQKILFAVALGVVAASVAVAVTAGLHTSDVLSKLEEDEAEADMQIAEGTMYGNLASTSVSVYGFAVSDELYDYMLAGDPSGGYFAKYHSDASQLYTYRITAIVYLDVHNRALESGSFSSDIYDSTSILFCDVVGFFKWSIVSPPRDVTEYLNGLICDFDRITEKHGALKVKTILDIYKDHAHVLCDVALDFMDLSASKTLGGEHLRLRIGVSSGPCAAGIIGKHQWTYDVWSDTVNMSARLKANAPPGETYCCSSTHEMVKGAFQFREPIEVPLKGKGVQTVFPLVGKSQL
eukprot:m51a1_g10920 putative family 3 adenylate cyclase (371) ;mRNA; f:98985-104760